MKSEVIYKNDLSILDKLDILRFISANLVILCHLIDQFIARKYGYEDPLGVGHLNCWLGILAVFCFFVLSGYVITFSVVINYKKTGYFDIQNYFSRRFFRIYPTALCSLVYMLAIFMMMKFFSINGLGADGFKLAGDVAGVPNYLSGLSFLYSVFLPPSGYFGGFFNVAMWTLSYEFGFYVCFGLLCYLKVKHGTVRTFIFVIFVSGFLFVWYTTNINSAESEELVTAFISFIKEFPSWNFLLFFAIWSLGVVLFFLSQRVAGFSIKIFTYLSCATIILMWIASKFFNVPFNYNVYSGMSALSDPAWSPIMTFAYGMWMMLFIYVVMNIELKSSLLRKVSLLGRKYSFTLYVTHYGMINLVFGLLWNSLNTFTMIDNILLFIFLIIITNAIACYLSTWFEHRDLWVNLFRKVVPGVNGDRGIDQRQGPSPSRAVENR